MGAATNRARQVGALSTATSSPSSSFPTSTGPRPRPGQERREPTLIEQLLALYAAREIEPEPVRLGPMPEHATGAMRAIAADIELRLGLLLAEGVTRALPYATSVAVAAGFVRLKGSASYALNRLVDDGVIRFVGEMPKLGKGNGTRLYVAPGWRSTEPLAVAIKRGGQQGLADLVWIPDEPREAAGAAAVQPHVELGEHRLADEFDRNESVVEHGADDTDRHDWPAGGSVAG